MSFLRHSPAGCKYVNWYLLLIGWKKRDGDGKIASKRHKAMGDSKMITSSSYVQSKRRTELRITASTVHTAGYEGIIRNGQDQPY